MAKKTTKKKEAKQEDKELINRKQDKGGQLGKKLYFFPEAGTIGESLEDAKKRMEKVNKG